MISLIDDEAAMVQRLIPIAAQNSRIGFEGSVGYFYRSLELIEKLIVLEDTCSRLGSLL